MSILNYIEKIKRENEGPRITAQEPRIGLQGGQLVQPNVDGSRPGYATSKKKTSKFKYKMSNEYGSWYSDKPSGPKVEPLTTATEKAHYKRLYGKEYNFDDWQSGNFTIKEEFSSSPGKKKVKRKLGDLRADFKLSLSRYLGRESELNKLKKRGYISLEELNSMLGRKNTASAIDDLGRALTGERSSSWLDEIPGVKKWKKSKLSTGSRLKRIEGGGGTFFKIPPKETLKGLKSYYKNQEYLSDFKYGRLQGDTIRNVQVLYDDEVLMKAIKQWSTKDEVPLKIIESVFGDGMTGPNSVMQLGKALKGDIKVPGVRKNVALGNKIIDAMAWEAQKGRGPWQAAAYEYAKGEMDNLFNLKKGQWNFNKYYNETRKIMSEAGVPGVIDEVVSLRTGFKNNQQVYSIFSQVIDEKINDRYKTGYDSQFSRKQNKIRDLIANKPEGWQKEVDDLVRTHEGNYKKMKTRFADVEFGRFGKFDVNKGTFQNPIEVFGEKRWNQLSKDIQAKILQGYKDTGITLNVGKTKTQKELFQLLKTAKTVKGPAKFKAMQAIITTIGTAAAASLFDKFGIQSAMADTGAAAPGVTAGDIALAGTAPLATKKGRRIYGKGLKLASKAAGAIPGFLGLEAFIGPGFVSSAGGSFSEAIASPLLLEGTMRNRRIYNKLKEQGLSTEDIETVKDSLMLDADPFMSSMMPTSKSATNPEIRAAASQAYDWASEEIAKEDEARLERADKFDYLQDTGFASGGLANLTRTVAPDSGPMSQGLRSLYIDDMDY